MEWVHELDVPDDAVPAVPLSFTAAAFTDAEFVNEDGIAPLEDLDIADTGVGDVCVDARCTMPPWSGAGTACYSLLERLNVRTERKGTTPEFGFSRTS